MSSPPTTSRPTGRFALACIGVATAISSLALAGWLLNVPTLSSFGSRYIPMAPSTALMFLVLNGALFLTSRRPGQPRSRILVTASVSVVALICSLVLIRFFTGAGPDFEKLLVPHPLLLGLVPIGRMSPFTAAYFLLASASLLLSLYSASGRFLSGSIAATLAAGVTLAGLVTALGYLYGAPLLYGGTIIPVAWTTALAFLSLGLGLTTAAGPATWLARLFLGASVRARLMRVVLPVTVAAVLVYGWLDATIAPQTSNPALTASLVALLSLIAISLVISGIAASLGVQIERAITERQRAEADILERNLELTAINEIGRALSRLADPAEIVEVVYEKLGAVLDNRNLYIALYDETTQQLSFPIYTIEGQRREPGGRAFGNGLTEYVIRAKAPALFTHDMESETARLGITPAGRSARSYLGVPLLAGERALGVIAVQDYEREAAFTFRHVELLSTIAAQVAIALENARLFAEQTQRTAELTTLHETTRDLTEHHELSSLLRTIVERATRLLRVPGAGLYQYDPARGDLELVLTLGAEATPVGTRLALGEGMAGRVAQTRQPLIISDYRTWEHRSPQYHNSQISAVLEVPMIYGGELIGVLAADEIGDTTRRFTEADARLLSLFAGQAASAIHNARLFEAERRRRQEAESLRQSAAALTSALDLRQVLDGILVHLAEIVPFDSAAVLLAEGDRLRVMSGMGFPDPEQVVGQSYPADDLLHLEVQRTGRPLFLPDAQADPRFKRWGGTDYVHGWMGVPLIVRGEIIGYLTLDSRQPAAYAEAEATLAQAFANQAAVAIDNARLYEEARRRATQLATLDEVGRAVSAQLDIEAALEVILEQLKRNLPLDTLIVALYDAATQMVSFPFVFDDGRRHTEPPVPLVQTLYMKQVIESGAPVFWNRAAEELAAAAETESVGVRVGNTARQSVSMLYAPLQIGAQTAGVISVQSYTPNSYTPEHLALLVGFARQAAIALHNARLFAETRQQLQDLEAVARISTALRSAQTLEEMIPQLLDQTLAAVGADAGVIWLANGHLAPAAARGWFAEIAETPVPPGEGIAGRVLTTGEAYVSREFATDPRTREAARAQVPPGWGGAAVAIHSAQAIIGVLFAAVPLPRELTESEIRLLSTLAEIAGSAIQRMRLHEQTEHRAEQLKAINVLGHALAETLDLGQIYEYLRDATLRLLPDTTTLFVSLFDPVEQTLTCAFGINDGQELDPAALPPIPLEPPGVGTQSEAVHTRRPVIVNDLPARLKQVRTNVRVGDSGPYNQSGLYVPMLSKGEVIGVVQVQSQALNRYTEADAELLSFAANTGGVALQNAQLFAETQRRLDRLQALRAIDSAISASLDQRVTLDIILDHVTAQLRADAAMVLLLNPHTQTLEPAASRGFRSSALRLAASRLGQGYAGRVALARSPVQVPDIRQAPEPFARAPLLAAEGIAAYFAAPMITKGQVVGVLEVFLRRLFTPDSEWLEFMETLAGQSAIAIENATLFDGLQRSNVELTLAYDATIEGWSRALDLRDKETEGHTQRVTELTLQLARALGLSEGDLVHVRRGGLLHDIGKMGVPDSILLKPGPLSDAEWGIMRKHPVYAYEMLAPIVYLRAALDIPYSHHEKWDGTGYPRGLKAEQIPLAARIFAVVDVWDALRSDRPYRPAWAEEKVRAHIRTLAGTHFDPQVVEVFLKLIGSE